jgi:hypothetical protein
MKKKEHKPQDFDFRRPLNKFGSKTGSAASWWYENTEESQEEQDETVSKLNQQAYREKAGF